MRWFLVIYLLSMSLHAGQVPRQILGLYTKNSPNPEDRSLVENFAEMPLNHLGYDLIPFDVGQGAPNLGKYPELAAILLWLEGAMEPNIEELVVDLIVEAASQDVKFICMGDLTLNAKNRTRLLALIGLDTNGVWVTKKHQFQFEVLDPVCLNFERDVQGMTTPFLVTWPKDRETQVLLYGEEKNNPRERSALVTVHPKGGYIASQYSVYAEFELVKEAQVRAWFVNPFLYFKKVLQDAFPKPDITTLAGRRIYYSHLDGDGWYSISLIPKYYNQKKICAHVILKEICEKYPNLPITIGAIGAELDRSWVATDAGVAAAKSCFALPNVEPGSHTFTHPYYWQFFENYTPEKEEPFLPLYPDGGWNTTRRGEVGTSKLDKFAAVVKKYLVSPKARLNVTQQKEVELYGGYEIPRYYALKPFDLQIEVHEAKSMVDATAPKDKPCALYQWSGNCMPFEAILEILEIIDMPNINGGDTRFDHKFPSYAWVSAIGRLVGSQRQIFTSASNENLYTNLWQDTFFGFKDLPETFKNTEMPIRVKPMNHYFHTYSGERMSSLQALHANLAYIESQKTCPIKASLFARMAQGFYHTKFEELEPFFWKVKDRGAIQTIRFDEASFLKVDFKKSEGVIGARHFQGSLYIYLDEGVEEPLIQVVVGTLVDEEPVEERSYLVESRWRVKNVRHFSNHFTFQAMGFGPGEMVWKVPVSGKYVIVYKGKNIEVEAINEVLVFTLPSLSNDQEVTVSVHKGFL